MNATPPSGELRGLIRQEIRTRGPIPFSRYMQLCLYHPRLGYYSQSKERFGPGGDFYTSSDIHAVLGRLLARQFDQMWRNFGKPPRVDVVELGPGRGLLMADVMSWAAHKFPDFHHAAHYVLDEQSPALVQELRTRFAEQIGRRKVEIGGVDDVYRSSYLANAIVFANELLDAFPVEVLTSEGQVYVALRGDDFVEEMQSPTPEVHAYVDRYSVRPEPGGRIEVPLAAMQLVHGLAQQIASGYFIAVDYGYVREEQLAGRHLDTLMTFRGHHAGTDPYRAPGEEDITAHVNFTAIRAIAEQAGMTFAGLATQSQFLMGIGEQDQFADVFEGCTLPQEHAKRALQLKHLVTPAGMGESFHVLVMTKGVTGALSGLSFGK